MENERQIGYHADMTADEDSARETIAEFGRKYLWWKPVGDQPHPEERSLRRR